MLSTLADARFPSAEIDRYVRQRYQYSDREFSTAIEQFEAALKTAAETWCLEAELLVRALLQSRLFEVVDVDCSFTPVSFLCELRIELHPPVLESQALHDLLAGLKSATKQLALVASGRPVPALLLRCAVFHRHPDVGYCYVVRTELPGDTAIARAVLDDKRWADADEVQVNPMTYDLLVRFLKPKLVALSVANNALNALNRFMRNRK